MGIMTVKSGNMAITDKDRTLLSILNENARTSTATIARRLGLSRSTVQAKIERLERSGVITGYGLRLSNEYERGIVKAHVLITIAPKAASRLTPELLAIREIKTLHSVSGSFDLIAIVAASSIQELDNLIDHIGEIGGVERTLSSVILSTRIDR